MSGAGLDYTRKMEAIRSILGTARGYARTYPSWFAATGDDLAAGLKELEHGLKIGKDGGFLKYLEGYLPRLLTEGARIETQLFGKLGGKLKPFYTKPRRLAEGLPRMDFEQLIATRVGSQAKEMYLYDKMDEAVSFTKNLPQQWKDFTELYIARILGRPSQGDEMIANILEPTWGKIARRYFGSERVWDARRVMTLAQNINDITYMGFLGAKPFSAMRNLFQPILNVSADLGGITDFRHLVIGYNKFAFDPKARKWMQDIGILTDYAPELMKAPALFGIKRKALGLNLPSRNDLRDVSMWMFRKSDEMNRYVSAGAAMSKWEAAELKYGFNKLRGADFLRVTEARMNGFLGKSGVNNRHPWMREEITNALRAGRPKDAKAIFVKDVVADTQYLYGGRDSPLIAQRWGLPTRTGAVFQSWWMNYGTMLEKWVRTGTIDSKSRRFMAWALYSAISMEIMEQMWSKQTAQRSTFLGPMPSPDQFFLPPAWEPVWRSIGTIHAAGKATIGFGESEDAWKQANALLSSSFAFLPAGLQIKQFYRGAKKEGTPGFLKAIIKYNPPEEED
jgi:hypothetical protein